MNKIIWTLIGIILTVIGNIFKRTNILFLGYYLTGTGKTRSIPEYEYKLAQYSFKWYQIEDTYMPVIFSGILYTTIGKAWVKVEHDCYIIKDRYMFYPLCEESWTHFSDCTCEDKKFTELYRAIYIPGKISYILYKTPLSRLDIQVHVNKFIRIMINLDSISYAISDEFWVNKGKPFDVYSEIPVCKD